MNYREAPQRAEPAQEKRQQEPAGPVSPTNPDQRPAESSPDKDKPSFPWLAAVVVVIVIVALICWGAYAHWRQNEAAAQTQQETANFVPTVRVAVAKAEIDPIEVTLPGQTEPFETANILARATGYVSERKVDIGSRVKKGDLLVHIVAPDLDQQLSQAEAQLGQVRAAKAEAEAQVTQAQANLDLQKSNLQRADTLTKQGFETVRNQQTQQTTVQSDEAALVTSQAGVKVAEANVRAQQATVDRLRALAAFENVVAPFDGVISVRNVEVGDLVNADPTGGTPLFTVDHDEVLRILVRIPQYSAEGIRDGLDADVTVPGIPGKTFSGKVARNSRALLYASRTLSAEVDLANPNGELRPGLFANVTFKIPRAHPNVSISSDALMFDQHGMRVAVVENNEAKMHKINIYRDLGATVEVDEGLKGGEAVVISPPVDLTDGAKVKVAPPERKQGSDQKSAAEKSDGKS